MRHLHVTRDGIVIRKVDSPSRHRAIEVYRAASGFGSFVGSFFGGAAKKGPLRDREKEKELRSSTDEMPPPPSYFHSISLPPSYFFSLARLFGGRNER